MPLSRAFFLWYIFLLSSIICITDSSEKYVLMSMFKIDTDICVNVCLCRCCVFGETSVIWFHTSDMNSYDLKYNCSIDELFHKHEFEFE